MNYVDSFNLFGTEAKQNPSITGSGAPTTSTEGAVGCLYMDTDTGALYKCTAAADGVYTWTSVEGSGGSAVSANSVLYTAQTLTESQKTQARENIGAAVEEASYYSSLSIAMTDVNNGVSDNALSTEVGAKVKVFTADNGRLIVMLLDDVSESAQIDITTDLDIVLNGHTISLTTAEATLFFHEGASGTINGEVAGSAIVKDVSAAGTISSACYTIALEGKKLCIVGGSYSMIGAFSYIGILIAGKTAAVDVNMEFADCELSIENTSSEVADVVASYGANYTRAVQISGNAVFKNVSVTANALGDLETLWLPPDEGFTCQLEDSTVRGISQKEAYGVVVYKTGTLIATNSTIFADAAGDGADEEFSQGIRNDGTIFLTNTDVSATMCAVQTREGSKTYVSGGTFTGYSHGGFYFAHGADGEAFINDAVIRCANYEGTFTDIFPGDTVAPYGGFYIGGGTEERNSNMTVYMDGCTIGTPTYSGFVMRATDGEANNTVNLSNCTINAATIRVDSGTGHLLNVGMGTNITESMISTPAQASFTGELYRKKHADSTCDGSDYTAIVGMFYNINDALDGIIAIQESLLGGVS